MKSPNGAWRSATTMSAIAVATLSLLAGCATTPVPADKLARSQTLVDAAEQARADAEPRATVHLQLAKEQLRTARRSMMAGENRTAEWTLRRAEADAEAALALAQAHTAKVDATRTIEAIRQAKSMMGPGGQGS